MHVTHITFSNEWQSNKGVCRFLLAADQREL